MSRQARPDPLISSAGGISLPILAQLRQPDCSNALARLSRVAATVLSAPIAHVTLIAENEQYHFGSYGLPEDLTSAEGIPLEFGFCPTVFATGERLMLTDLAASEFRDNPAVVERGARAYAGTPLRRADGAVIGSLCVLDVTPREWAPELVDMLGELAESVVTEIELAAALDDASEAFEQAEHERSMLAVIVRVGELLTTSAADQDVLQQVADLLVPQFADWCIVDQLAVHAGTFTVTGAISADDPSKAALLRQLRREFPYDVDSAQPEAEAIRTHNSVVLTGAEVLARASDGEQRDVVAQLDPDSVASIPLIARGMSIGAITFGYSGSGRSFDAESERTSHEDIARRISIAIEASQLYAAAQERADAARVIEHISEGVVMLDDDRRVLLWNPAASALTAISPSDALGRRIEELFADWPIAIGLTSTVHNDGEEGACLAVSGVSWDAGSVYAMRDVSDEQRLARTRDELISTLSHQLRTPLASIYAGTITLRREDITLGPDTIEKLLATIEQQACRLTDLSDEILLASRLDSGSEHIVMEPVDLTGMFDEIVDGLSVQEQHAGRLQFEGDAETVVSADHAALQQVVCNLIDNALKYSPVASPVHVSSSRGSGGRIVISVADEGDGIPMSDRENVFEKFYRRDPHMRQGVTGTGLGLFICRELVRSMRGRIWIEDRAAGPGVSFHVELDPAGKESAQECVAALT